MMSGDHLSVREDVGRERGWVVGCHCTLAAM
jgi:hypothetical protein